MRGPVPAGAVGRREIATIATAWGQAPCIPCPNQRRPDSGEIQTHGLCISDTYIFIFGT